MSTARDGSLPRREIPTKRPSTTKPSTSTTHPNGENMPRKLTAFNEAQKMVAEANRSMGLTRSSSNRALYRRTSNKEPTRSQRFRLSDEDSSDEDSEDDSQGKRRVSQWFAPKGKSKEKVVVEVEDDEEATGTGVGTQVRVKAERRNSQAAASTRRQGGGASMNPDASAVIDLTLQSTDDEASKAKSTTQRPKPKTTSAGTSKPSGSQRPTTEGKTAMKKAGKTPPGRSEAEKARLKRMMSGGSGKSEGDSIVLLDTDEEDVPKRPVVSQPIIKPSPSQREALARKVLSNGSPMKTTDTALVTSHSQTMAQWRNTAPASSSARQLSRTQSSSSINAHPTRSSQTSKAPHLYTTPSTSSPSKGRTPVKTSQTSVGRDGKRMEMLAPPIGTLQDDVDMDHDDASEERNSMTLRSGAASPSVTRSKSPRTRRELSVEIPLMVRRSPRAVSADIRSPMKPVVSSPLHQGVTRTPGKVSASTSTPHARTPVKTPTKTPTKMANVTPSRGSATPQSSILSSVSSRSRGESRTPQQTPRINLDTDQFESLARIVQDVPVTFSDGAVPEPVRQAAEELLTPTKASFSQSSRLLGKSASFVTPLSPRNVDAFLRSPSRLSAASSLPSRGHRDMLAIPSPSKRASMERLVPIRQLSQSAHAIRHIDFGASPAGKRKVPGSPIVEENASMDSPKRRHLSPPEEQAPSTSNALRPRPRRAKPVFAASPGRVMPFVEMPLSPARSIRTDRGSAPNTPSKLGSFASHHMISTAQASPVQEYDTDRSYVSSSVMEEKMPLLIPQTRTLHQPAADDKMDTADMLDDGFKVGEDLDMAEVVDENVDLLDMFGDFDWTSDQPQATVPADDALSTTPVSKSVEEAEESLIDTALQHSPSQRAGDRTSPRTDAMDADTHETPVSSKPDVASKKAFDIFAELKAKHDQEELERRQKEEAARKKILADSDEGESDDDLTSLLVSSKPRVAPLTSEDDRGKGYGLRSSIEPTTAVKPALPRYTAQRASPMPAALAKMHREMKKEKRAKAGRSGMSALELARLNLELLEDEQEDEAAARDIKFDIDPARIAADLEAEDSESSGTEADDFMDGSDEEDAGEVELEEGETALSDLPAWKGAWEEITEQKDSAQGINIEESAPAFARFTKSPRLLMAVLPNVIQSVPEKASEILLSIITAFPAHPISDAAVRMFAIQAPDAYDESLWNQHLVRIGQEYSDVPSTRSRATIHWLECLSVVLREAHVSDAELDRLVLCLAKLGIDRRSDFVLRRAAIECLNAAIKNASEQTLERLAFLLAEFSRPFAGRKIRVRLAATMGVATEEGKTLKKAFALRCLADSGEETTIMTLPKMMKDKALASFSQESSRGILATVRALIVLLTHVHNVIDAVGKIGWEARETTMSEAEARKPEWEIRKRAVNEWRGEMMDALRWLKSGMYNKGKRTSPFRQVASTELTDMLNRFEQSSKYYMDMLRPPQTQIGGFFRVKSERGTPAPEAVGIAERRESPAPGTQRPGGRPKPLRRAVVKTEV